MTGSRPTRWLAAAAACALVVFAATPARADQASSGLARHDAKVDEAIDRALAYLAKHQVKDGSFPSGMPGNTAVASLSVMAFLAKGYTPGVGPYGEVIDRGIDYVISAQNGNGLLVGERGQSHGPMYSHGVSTLMLSEVSGMVEPKRQERVDKALGKALKLILSAQRIKKDAKHSGGWRYQPHSRDSDISCTGWQLMALRSARNNGALVPKQAIDEALKYLLKVRNSATGAFVYQPGGPDGLARTGTGLLCVELCGLHGDKVTYQAGKWILAHLPRSISGQFFYYGLYYCSQGMFQVGSEYWEGWADNMYRLMLSSQSKDGSWPGVGQHESRAGTCYATAMTVLAMTVSYRQLPIYQR